MRLIILLNVPDHTESIPFDVLDDRSSNMTLKDMLLFLKKLSSNEETHAHYGLSMNGKKLNLNVSLAQNGVKNGDHLDLVETNEPIELKPVDPENLVVRKVSTASKDESDSIETTIKEKDRKHRIPGKKIDFD